MFFSSQEKCIFNIHLLLQRKVYIYCMFICLFSHFHHTGRGRGGGRPAAPPPPPPPPPTQPPPPPPQEDEQGGRGRWNGRPGGRWRGRWRGPGRWRGDSSDCDGMFVRQIKPACYQIALGHRNKNLIPRPIKYKNFLSV